MNLTQQEMFNYLPYAILVFIFLPLGFFIFKPQNIYSEQSSSKLVYFGLLLITILGGILRLYGLDFGFPSFYHPDEHKKTYIISKMLGKSTLDPNYFLHPSLLFYLTILINKILVFLNITNLTEFFGASFEGELNTSTRVLYSGRLISMIFGTLSIPVLFFTTRLLFGTSIAFLSSCLLAFSPLHVTCSRYLKEDSLLTFFILLTLYFSARFLNFRNHKDIYIASLISGFAIGTKYTGVLLVLLIFFLPWLIINRINLKIDYASLKHVFLSLPLILIGFFICSPYSLINLTQSSGGIIAEASHAVSGHHGLVINPLNEWFMFHFARTIIPGTSFLIATFSLITIGGGLRFPQKNLSFIIVTFFVFYLSAELIPSKPMPQPDRYILPCIPLLCILSSIFLVNLQKPLAIFSFSAILIFTPLQRSLALARDLPNDTRRQATKWIEENLDKSSKIITLGGKQYLCKIPRNFHSSPARKIIGKEKTNIASRLKNSGYDYLIYSNFIHPRFYIYPHPALERKVAMEEIKKSFKLVKQFNAESGSYGFHNPTIDIYSLR